MQIKFYLTGLMISFVLAGCVTVTPTQEDSKTIDGVAII
jgi:hypothetical protein